MLKNDFINIDNFIIDSMKKNNVPGLSLGMAKDDKSVINKNFGVKNMQTGTFVSDSTTFEAASITKTIAAYGALKLAETGRMDLDTPLNKYLGEKYLDSDNRIDLITARHVLSHTSGFPNWRTENGLKIHSAPGEKFSYSGEGFVLLQKTIEKITTLPFDKYINESIFEPFGMIDSSLVWKDKYITEKASPHNELGITTKQREFNESNAAWSMVTSGRDYINFISKILFPEVSNISLLNESYIHQMLSPQIRITDNISWGLGWGIEHAENGNLYWHWGDNDEFKAFTIFSSAHQYGFVFLTNGSNGLKVIEDILNNIYGQKLKLFKEFLVPFYQD